MSSNTIDFGIDLGTTNSLIARFSEGQVSVFKNPSGFKETLPSIVGFRNDRTLVGEKARTYGRRDPRNVFARFKRKMGTKESFRVPSVGRSITPIELSAEVLKELKTFVVGETAPTAAVITIPASFDMAQSAATQEAGALAGFSEVVLLQEPIAASLAYANWERALELRDSQWIVYDLGGGTFDVALVRIDGELRVVDHEGDNYLGGTDFDSAIVEKIICPRLEELGNFKDLWRGLRSEGHRYNDLWASLLSCAEEAKCELSTATAAELDLVRFDIADDDDRQIDAIIPITRSDFESCIKPYVDRTVEMIGKILTRNSLRPSELQFALMVGGSSFIPLVRERVSEMLGIPAKIGMDPTNAIAVGAAYYAATKERAVGSGKANPIQKKSPVSIRASYEKATRESEEIFSAKITGAKAGYTYRITSKDGSYDSGKLPLSERIMQDLPLTHHAYNVFTLTIYDETGTEIPHDLDPIQIAHGKYSVAGQMLPEDLSLVKDDVVRGDTTLDMIFKRSTVLPARATRTVDVSRTLIQGSEDEIRIIVVEGDSDNHFSANKAVGRLTLSARELNRDLIKGSEIDLTFEVSESRLLTVTAYVNPSGPEFSHVFNTTDRDVSLESLAEEIQILDAKLKAELEEALADERYEVIDDLKRLNQNVELLTNDVIILTDDDVTDDRYKLDDKKREVARNLSRLTSGKLVDQLRSEYEEARTSAADLVSAGGNDAERHTLNQILAREPALFASSNPKKFEQAISSLRTLAFGVLKRTPQFLVQWFQDLENRRHLMNDQIQARSLIDAGTTYVQSHDFEKLASVNMRLHFLLPQSEQESDRQQYFTGIS